MVDVRGTLHMKYQIFLITKSFKIDWTYWIVPSILSIDERDKLLRKILYEDVFPFLPGIDVSMIAEIYGPNSSTGLWFNYAYFFPFNTKDILLLVKKASEGVDIGGRGIWKFAGIVIDSKQREKQTTRSLLHKYLNSSDLFQLTDEFYSFNARPPLEKTISKNYEFLLPEDENSETKETIEFEHLPEIKTEFGQRGYVTLNPNRDNLNLLLNQIANTQIKIPYFLIGPFKKKGEYEQQSIIGATSSNDREEIQSSEPVGEDNHVDRMPPNMINIPTISESNSPLDTKGDEPISENEIFETPRSDEIQEENINFHEMPKEKGKLSPINFIRTVPIRLALEAYKFTLRVFDKDKDE